MNQPHRRKVVTAVVLVAAAGALTWLTTRPVPVLTHPVSQQVVVAEVMGTGTLEARVTYLQRRWGGRSYSWGR